MLWQEAVAIEMTHLYIDDIGCCCEVEIRKRVLRLEQL